MRDSIYTMQGSLRTLGALLGALLALGCAGASAPPPDEAPPVEAPPPSPVEAREAPVELRPLAVPGSRVTLGLPASTRRVPHSLVLVDPERALSIAISDADVAPGTERARAEQELAALGPSVVVRPIVFATAQAIEATLVDAEGPLRAITLFREGAMARVVVRHRAEDALLVERILETLRLDTGRAIDPLAALDVRAQLEGLVVVPVTNLALLLRTQPHLSAFPSAAPSVEVSFVPFGAGERPTSDRERGQLLGARFAGMALEGTQITPLEGPAGRGFEIVSTTPHDATRVALYGAYVEGEHGCWLVRASVAADRAPEWGPRFRALVASLGAL